MSFFYVVFNLRNLLYIIKVLGVSSTTAYELLHQKDFPSVRVGSRLIVPKEKFREWVNSQTERNG